MRASPWVELLAVLLILIFWSISDRRRRRLDFRIRGELGGLRRGHAMGHAAGRGAFVPDLEPPPDGEGRGGEGDERAEQQEPPEVPSAGPAEEHTHAPLSAP